MPNPFEELEQRLRPGAASDSGFLAAGESLSGVLESDRLALEALTLDVAQIADRLEIVLGRAERLIRLTQRLGGDAVLEGVGWRVQVEPQLSVRATHFAGSQDCPFHDSDGRPCPLQPWASGDFELTHAPTGRTIRVPGLLPHLVRAHSFFEGSVPYRVDPVRLAEILGLAAGVHARPEWRTESVWAPFSVTEGLPWFGIGGPRWYWQPAMMENLGISPSERPRRWDERVELARGITASRAGGWCVLVVRGRGRLEPAASLDGCALDVPRAPRRGTYELRRVQRSHVALEGE